MFDSRILSSRIVLKRFLKLHGDRYDYSKFKYINRSTKSIVICKEHGEFKILPYAHWTRDGCPKCKYLDSMNETKSVISKCNDVHNNKYDYSKFIYNGVKKKSIVICKKHGEFEQEVNSHLRGAGCPKCFDEKRKFFKLSNTNDFINKAKKIHKDKYDYSKTVYVSSQLKVNIYCKKCESFFSQKPTPHLMGSGCPKCVKKIRKTSRSENEIFNFIKENYKGEIRQNTKPIYPLELDIYLPELKLAFEFNGIYWHNELFKDKFYHLDKTKRCIDKDIHLIHIYEDDWNLKQDIIKSRILNLLGKSKRIYARKCKVAIVKDYKQFLIDTHTQGYIGSQISLGLYYQGELVSLMSFGKARFRNKGFELLRFVNKLNTTVIGGASKLFKSFDKRYNTPDIITYADRSWSNGNLYIQLGFTFVSETEPNYHYVVNEKRRNRFGFRKTELVKLGFDKSLTEREIMNSRNMYRIYDSGQLKYERKIINEKIEIC